MTLKYKRGPVGTAACKLKESLLAKLAPVGRDTAGLNDALMRAINAVSSFILNENEDMNEFEKLKDDVKKILLMPGVPKRRAVSTSSHHHHNSAHPCFGREMGRLRSAPLITKDRTFKPTGHQKFPCISEEEIDAWSNKQSQARSLGEPPDFTLPAHFLRSKAYAMEGLVDTFEQMVVNEDLLAKEAERQRQMDRIEAAKRTRERFGSQLAELRVRQQHDAEKKLREHQAAKQDLQRMVKEEAELKQKRLELQAGTRKMLQAQLDEVAERKRQEEEKKGREARYERIQHIVEERQERQRREKMAKDDEINRARIKAELDDLQRHKMLELKKGQEEERRATEEAIRVANEREAQRVADVAKRAAKLKAAFERAGGVALTNNMEERARADAERARRIQQEYEAKLDARLEREKLRRQEETRMRVCTLKEQMAEREAAQNQEAQERIRLRAQFDAEREAQQNKEREDKEALKRDKALKFAEMRSSVLQEQQRKYLNYVHRIPEADKWVHKAVLLGQDRGFSNLSVPVNFHPLLSTTTSAS
ncbi:hypothetical protein CEUSTIGMA_g5091.t1 [Chlamydomonas eustigma]|uniref:Trichohyalin-plectin-homology domain-containing protein n=1 Tax=Chlamydomonas eustigma TaxID=1157962 RepID=A0A250X3J8_9CHLO|nr:hypothetical protein CEUSTIGMA_g5091.t1 [Chlamydomonas eustigma]|eukprot:GAX77648.1 hypothetical protein CEUSTIGMA_g5091.t1 [Chlamydomonas eustigma]